MYAVQQIAPLIFRVVPTRDYTNVRTLGLDRAAGKLRRRGCSVLRLGTAGHAEIRLPAVGKSGADCSTVTAEELQRFINHQ